MGPLALQEGAKHPQGEEVIHFIQKAFRRLRQVVHELRRIKKAVRLFALRANTCLPPHVPDKVFCPQARQQCLRRGPLPYGASPVVCSQGRLYRL